MVSKETLEAKSNIILNEIEDNFNKLVSSDYKLFSNGYKTKHIIQYFLPTFEDKGFINFKQSIKQLLLDSGARELASAKKFIKIKISNGK